MKKTRRMLSFVLALVLCLAMGITAFAASDGSIIVTNATAGQTYEAFLIFPASPSNPEDVRTNIIYTATAEQVAVDGFDTYFDKIIDENRNYTISKKTDANDEALIGWIKQNIESLKQGSAIPGVTQDDGTVKFDNLKYGYYYITSTLGAMVTIDTAGKEVKVVDKNESTPEGPDKMITAEDNAISEDLDQSDASESTNDTSVGSTETFTVTFDATNWVKEEEGETEGTKITEWNFTDTPTGLAINKTTVKVFVNDTEVTSTVTDIAVSAEGVLTFTIPWVDANGKHLYKALTPGSELIPVKVVYDAEITADAATAIAPNDVVIEYNGDTQLGEATTTTYTYKFKLEKKDENEEALKGAEFELYFGASENALTFTVDDNGNYRFDPEATETHIKPSGDDAVATIIGLDNATYSLKEVVVPAGYNKAEDTTVTGLSRVDVADANITEVEVKNKKGAELPSTGGMGTTIFYVVGAVLVIGAGVVLIARRRMNSER